MNGESETSSNKYGGGAKNLLRLIRAKERAIESSINAITIADLDGNLTYVNPAFLDMWGYENEREVLGEKSFDIWNLDADENILAALLEDEEWFGEVKAERRNGEEFDVQLSASVITDDSGEPEGMLAMFADITKRKKMEEREEFLHSLLRHDLGNKIQIIQNSLSLLGDSNLSEEQKEFVKMATEAGQESFDLVGKVRSLRKIENEKLKDRNIGIVIDKVVSENESQANEEGIQIDSNVSEHKVQCGELLEEIFTNLIGNSVQHSGGSKIKVSTKELDNEILCIIEDDGNGIPEEEREKIFERGYKRGKNAGSGLGMFIVKEITKNYDGNIEVKDSEMGGARFEVRLKKA